VIKINTNVFQEISNVSLTKTVAWEWFAVMECANLVVRETLTVLTSLFVSQVYAKLVASKTWTAQKTCYVILVIPTCASRVARLVLIVPRMFHIIVLAEFVNLAVLPILIVSLVKLVMLPINVNWVVPTILTVLLAFDV
jgi:hypothetical protein